MGFTDYSAETWGWGEAAAFQASDVRCFLSQEERDGFRERWVGIEAGDWQLEIFGGKYVPWSHGSLWKNPSGQDTITWAGYNS